MRTILAITILVASITTAGAHHAPGHYEPLPAGADGSCPKNHTKRYDYCEPNEEARRAIDAGETRSCPTGYARDGANCELRRR